uniref:Uncharacterized protein n=1 Tax=Oryza brachyantha TaxID=4533 RepID=J3M3S0_ORYBR
MRFYVCVWIFICIIYLHHEGNVERVDAGRRLRQHLLLGDRHRVVEQPPLLQAARRRRLHEPRPLAGARHPRLAAAAVHEPPGERVVLHQRLPQRLPDHHPRRRLTTIAAPGLEHVQRPHQVAQPGDAVDHRQRQRLRRRRRRRRHQRAARPRPRESHRREPPWIARSLS